MNDIGLIIFVQLLLSSTIAWSGNSVDTLIQQGWNLENQGRSQEALEIYNQALQINPNNFLVHKQLGIHWARENKFEQGIIELNVERADCIESGKIQVEDQASKMKRFYLKNVPNTENL